MPKTEKPVNETRGILGHTRFKFEWQYEDHEEVVVARKGQTTIPVSLRKKYGIREGSRLRVEDTGNGILLKKVPSIYDLIGSGSKYATVEEVKRLLDEMRAEEDEG